MEKSRITTAIWDLDGTMWLHRDDEIDVICENLRIYNTDQIKPQFYSFIRAFSRHFKNRRVTIKEVAWLVENELKELCIYGISGEEFLDVWFHAKCNFLNEGAHDVLTYMRDYGLKNIVLTDWFNVPQNIQLKEFGLRDFFEEVHCIDDSYLKSHYRAVDRAIKPDKEKQYIIIGDSPTSDLVYARNANIASIFIKGKQNDTGIVPTYEISSLLEIIPILESW